jgi:precorrin-8X/cobalt-precorrin-8 methylmutase
MNLTFENKDCHLLVIGHGSSDKSARIAFEYTIDKLLPIFKSVDFCFLELDNPDIQQGVRKVLRRGTGNLIVVPYFLHEGAHVKRDVRVELNSALEKYGKRDIYITTHLGSGEELVEAMVERAREVESKIVL